METKVKHREWVKTAAIIFLAVLLVLTFFSNTIMNHSLPEVAAKYVESGTINARIRGSGTIAANEVYDVTLSQTRKIRSVLVKVGQQVSAGDPLFQLESMESEELKAAQQALDQMELSYQKSLIEAANSNSTEDRNIQKLRDDYNEALQIYRIYSTSDPTTIELKKKEAEKELSEMEQTKSRLENELEELKTSSQYLRAADNVKELQANLDAANAQLTAANAEKNEIVTLKQNITQAENNVTKKYNTTYNDVYSGYERFVKLVCGELKEDSPHLETAANDVQYFLYISKQNGYTIGQSEAEDLQKKYKDIAPIITMKNSPVLATESEIQNKIDAAQALVKIAEDELYAGEETLSKFDREIEVYEENIPKVSEAVQQKRDEVANYTEAASAATTLKAAQEALEDAVFQASLGDSSNLDIQAAKEAIEEQKKVVEELTDQADGQEVTANVSGTVSAINVTAGGTAGAEQAIAQITVADRGYTIKIPVTAEQARQVRVGDTAEITNYYWGGITATLENIASDPSSMGKGKMLIFRIEGEDLEAGTNLTLSIGQRSANYDCLVPNSAVRTDSNGSFVLVVVAKSSPLGNRYVATRADVQVLASDDTTSAVSGLANGDFVITTSNKPLEAGDLVRLPDNG